MADEEKKRIVQYQEASDFRNDDYALIDNSITGTRKIKVDGKLVKVTDVQVDNTTVMDGSIAKIDLTGKQDVLTPGANIQISGSTISATDTTYSAGTNIQINAQNKISATDTTYSAFSGSSPGLVPASDSSSQTKYLRGDGSWATPPGGGGGGSTVSITPIVTSGTQIATATVDGVTSDLYAPTPPTVSVNQIQSTGTKIGEVVINNVANDLYAPNPTQVSIGQIQSTGTKIASISVNGSATDLYAPAGGESVSVTQLQSTGTAIATVTVGSTATDIYAPPSGSMVQISNTQPSGTTLATLTIDGNATDIKMPAGSNIVDQVPNNTDNRYELLFAGSTGNTTYTGSVNKSDLLSFNPNYSTLQVGLDDPDPLNPTQSRVYITTDIDGYNPSASIVMHTPNSWLEVNEGDISIGGPGSRWCGKFSSLQAALDATKMIVFENYFTLSTVETITFNSSTLSTFYGITDVDDYIVTGAMLYDDSTNKWSMPIPTTYNGADTMSMNVEFDSQANSITITIVPSATIPDGTYGMYRVVVMKAGAFN